MTNLTWPNNALAITSNMEANTRILIFACSSADNPLNSSTTLILALLPASWYLRQRPHRFEEIIKEVLSNPKHVLIVKTKDTWSMHYPLLLW